MQKLLRNGDPAGAATVLCEIDFEALSDHAQTCDYLMLARGIRNDYKLVSRFAESMNWTEDEFVTMRAFEDAPVHQISDDNWLLEKLKSHIKRFPESVALHALLLDDLASSADQQDSLYPLLQLTMEGRLAPEIESTYIENRILSRTKHPRLNPTAMADTGFFHELLSAQQFWQMQASINLQQRDLTEFLKSCSTAMSLPRSNWWEKYRGHTAGAAPTEIGGVQYYLVHYRGRLYALSWRLHWPLLSFPSLSYPFIGFLEPGRWLIEALHYVAEMAKDIVGDDGSFFSVWRKKILRHGILRGQDLRSLALQLQEKTRSRR